MWLFLLGALIVASTLVGLIGAPRVQNGAQVRSGHPGWWLLAVTALIYLNQLLFTVYVTRVHHGDVTFISRYLPNGWFDLADIGGLAVLFPAPELLSITVLRVQAFLELPFVVLAYLTVCRWLDGDVCRRATRLVWPAAIAYTAVFCLVEVLLTNPYTTDDVIVRIVSAVVVGLAVPRLCGPGTGGVTGPLSFVGFLAAAGALGHLILVVYDTALLYNLGHLADALPGALIAVAVMTTARLAARTAEGRAGPTTTTLISGVGWFLVVFFVPALAIRYGVIEGVRPLALLAGLMVVGTAALLAVRPVFSAALLARLAAAAAVAAAAATAGYLATRGYPEARLLVASVAFAVTSAVTCALLDHLDDWPDRHRRSRWV